MDSLKPRQSNFSKMEEMFLLEEVQKRYDTLFGAFSGPGMGRKRKAQAWEEVTTSFNSQSTVKRESGQLKKKFNNIKADAKSKISKSKYPKTGGGAKSPELTSAENLFLDICGDMPSVKGIDGGVESEVATLEWKSPFSGQTYSLLSPSQIQPGPSIQATVPEIVPSPQLSPSRTLTASPAPLQLFPTPGAKKTKNPRSDKLKSDLEIEVLRLEKERVEAVLELIQLKKRQAVEKHDAKLKLLKLKCSILENQN